MCKRFDHIRTMNTELEQLMARAKRLKPNTKVSSNSDIAEQIPAMRDAFRRLKINRYVTVRMGTWFRTTPLVDVLVDFGGVQARTGEEAGELSQLMTKTYALIRTMVETLLPRCTGYCPAVGVSANGWRFQ